MANVPINGPFGGLDISKAGNTTASVGTWARDLKEDQRREISGRCNVIMSPGEQNRYHSEDVRLCQNYASAMGEPGSNIRTEIR